MIYLTYSKIMTLIRPEILTPFVRILSRHPTQEGHHWKRTNLDFQLILVLEGVLCLEQEDGSHRAEAGQLLLLWPGVAHDLWVKESVLICTVHFDPIAGAKYKKDTYRFPDGQPSKFHSEHPRLMEHLFEAMWESFQNFGLRHEQVLSHILTAILSALLCSTSDTQRRFQYQRMEILLTFIRHHLSRQLDRHDLAEELGVTPQHVNYLVKNHFGMTVSALIHRERAIAAHQLLTQGMSVGEAGRQVGYQDPFTFSREFKKHMGVSPKHAFGVRAN